MEEPRERKEVKTEAGFGTPVSHSIQSRIRHEFPAFINKNRGLTTNPEFWRHMFLLGAMRATRSRDTPDAPLKFVSTHHKVMTTYFNAVLRLLGWGLRSNYQQVNLEQPDPGSRLVLSAHGKLDLPALKPYRGVHVMRDPRDMIVSGYHYHLWTREKWVHRPDEHGVSYQQKLRAKDKRDGLFMEIDHFIFFYRSILETWDLNDPDILEVTYEDLMGDQREMLYEKLFSHLGYSGKELKVATGLMRLFEANSRTGRRKNVVSPKSHVRSGKSGQWREELEPDHISYIEQELGGVLRKFGY